MEGGAIVGQPRKRICSFSGRLFYSDKNRKIERQFLGQDEVKMKRQFFDYCHIPMVVGLIDGTHIRLASVQFFQKSRHFLATFARPKFLYKSKIILFY